MAAIFNHYLLVLLLNNASDLLVNQPIKNHLRLYLLLKLYEYLMLLLYGFAKSCILIGWLAVRKIPYSDRVLYFSVFGPWSVFFRIRTGILDIVVLSCENFKIVFLVDKLSIKFY